MTCRTDRWTYVAGGVQERSQSAKWRQLLIPSTQSIKSINYGDVFRTGISLESGRVYCAARWQFHVADGRHFRHIFIFDECDLTAWKQRYILQFIQRQFLTKYEVIRYGIIVNKLHDPMTLIFHRLTLKSCSVLRVTWSNPPVNYDCSTIVFFHMCHSSIRSS